MVPSDIRTERLILRRSTAADAEAIFSAYAADPVVTQYLTWKTHSNADDVAEFLKTLEASWDNGQEYAWTLLEASDNRIIGQINLRVDRHRAESGYVLMQAEWGKGFMTEALTQVRKLAFDIPSVERFQIVCDVDNPASARVMEKAGFEYEGILRRYSRHPNSSDTPRDCLCYSAIRE